MNKNKTTHDEKTLLIVNRKVLLVPELINQHVRICTEKLFAYFIKLLQTEREDLNADLNNVHKSRFIFDNNK